MPDISTASGAKLAAVMICLMAGSMASAQVAVADGDDAPAAASPVAQGRAGDCGNAAGKAEAATDVTRSADGADPANSGNTGWSGGTGGSQIGTNPQGAVAPSSTWHAPTARGLDLAGRAEPVEAAC